MHKSLTTKQCKMIKDAKYSNDTNNNSSQISVFYTKIQKLKHHSSHRITQFNPMHTEHLVGACLSMKIKGMGAMWHAPLSQNAP